VSVPVGLISPALSSDKKKNYINFLLSIFKIGPSLQIKTDSLYSRRFWRQSYMMWHCALLQVVTVMMWHCALLQVVTVMMWHCALLQVVTVMKWHCAFLQVATVVMWHCALLKVVTVMMWHCALLQMVTIISEETSASIFGVQHV
jgi:hypothetical protein